MKIKEVENVIGITKANIRYYEKEGLLEPVRNEENNYREYSAEDVECLKRIKTLRLLGISISEIKQLNNEQLLLKDVMESRLNKLQEEERNLLEIRQICETIIQNNIPLSAVNESLLDKNNENWKTILEKIMHEDITKENLTKKQFNRNIIIMLLWGYMINIVIAGLFGNDLLQASEITLLCLMSASAVIGSICYIGVYFTSNVKLHFIFFHVSALALTPLITSVYLFLRMFLNPSGLTVGTLKQIHLVIFWMILLIYAILFFCLADKRGGALKEKHIVAFSFAYTCLFTLIFGFLWNRWLFPFAYFLAFTLYTGTCWRDALITDKSYNRYYAINTGGRMINICGAFWNMHGKTTRSEWVRR